jgi:hypothetical protein
MFVISIHFIPFGLISGVWSLMSESQGNYMQLDPARVFDMIAQYDPMNWLLNRVG